MNQFDEWWGKGKGSEQWARTIEKDILGAIKVAFNAGVSSENKRSSSRESELAADNIALRKNIVDICRYVETDGCGKCNTDEPAGALAEELRDKFMKS